MSRLETDQIVDVCLAGGWRRTVRVVAVGAAHADVIPLDGPVSLPAGIEAWEATIEWRAERGLARAGGTLTDGAGVLRFQEMSEELVMQRRSCVRVRAGVTVTVAGLGDDPILTETLDLSLGGMLLTRADSLRVGDDVRFVLAIGESETFAGKGRIVRGTPFGHRAISFRDVSGADERRLARFVAEIERRHCAIAAALR
jgi:PilZ domain-containing protein